MKITLEEIKKTAKLAKFDITQEEAQLYAQQLSAVLDWVEELKSLDLSAAVDNVAQTPAPLRADAAVLSPARENIVAAFNDKEQSLLKVKKVL